MLGMSKKKIVCGSRTVQHDEKEEKNKRKERKIKFFLHCPCSISVCLSVLFNVCEFVPFQPALLKHTGATKVK